MTGIDVVLTGIGYLLIIAEGLLTGSIVVRYTWALKASPRAVRLLPIHVLLIAAGTLLLSGVGVARMVQYPRTVWSIFTLIPIGMIVAALFLVRRWQHRATTRRSQGTT